MENWLTKIVGGTIASGIVFGIVKFMLHYYVNRIDRDIKEIKDEIKSEVASGRQAIDAAFKRVDENRSNLQKLGERISKLQGYIEGKESK
jgi:ubiquinone biosynthesis protein UbiJ